MMSVTDGRDSQNTAVKIRAALLQGRVDYLSKQRVLLNSIEFRFHRAISVDLKSKFSKKNGCTRINDDFSNYTTHQINRVYFY